MNKKVVNPIQNPKDLESIRDGLTGNVRNLLLFDMAIQTGLPAKQWLGLKVSHLIGLNVGDPLPIRNSDNALRRTAVMTEDLYKTFKKFMNEKHPHEDDFLFRSNKGSDPLSLPSASRLVKSWLKEAGLVGASGLLTLRKTWDLHYSQSSPSSASLVGGMNIDSKIKKIQVPTRQAAVFGELEKKIVTGRLMPGQRLIVEEVANQMGVSPIPVREAFGRLEARGFISTRPQWGSTVNELSRANLIEIYEIRLFLERFAAERAAVRRNKDTLDRLNHFQKEYWLARKGNDPDKLLSFNKKFHYTIYQAANMPILMDMIQQLWDRVSPYYHIFFRQSEKPKPYAGIEYHHRIMAGIQKGDPEETCKWLKADLHDSTKFILELFEIYGKQSIRDCG